MAMVTDARLQEAFIAAVEDRSEQIADLVSNAEPLLAVMKANGGWKPFSGPTIRETLLYAETGSYTRYSGYGLLNPVPAEILNDAEFMPKLAAVSVTLSGEDLLKAQGRNARMDLFTTRIKAAERELRDRFYEDLHSDGTADGGKQVTGFAAALPIDPTVGVYGGIDRAVHSIWRTKYSTTTALTTKAWSHETAHNALSGALAQVIRGADGPNVIAMDANMYRGFLAATLPIQRITSESKLARLGFVALEYAGMGRAIDVVMDGGIGSPMPSNTCYIVKMGDDGFKFRYHPARNFVAFGGKRQPTNQDAVVQHIGFFGNLTLQNPLWQMRLVAA